MSTNGATGSIVVKFQATLACGLIAGAASAATLQSGYTPGTNSQLSVENGGSATNLFVDFADVGGDDITDTDGYSDFFNVLIDGEGKWRVGDTVEITGFALPVHASTVNGTLNFEVIEGSGGIGDSGAGGLASMGSATAAYTNNGSTEVVYVNFDSPVSFVVDANSYNIGINIENQSGLLRLKNDPTYPVPRYNRINGNFIGAMKVSVAGNVIPTPVVTNSDPVFSLDPFSKPLGLTGVPYVGTLADVTSDPENDGLTFSVLSFNGLGTNWLGFDGYAITGTPQVANIGTNEWTLLAADPYGGTNSATMTIEVVQGTGNMIPGYAVGSAQLRPNGETIFVDTAALGGNVDINDPDGFAPFYTVFIPGTNRWDIGDTVTITGFALALRAPTANGTMTFEIRQAAGGTGPSGAAGLSAIGTNTATFSYNGSTSTYFVNFDAPFSFVVDENTTDIGINIRNSGNLAMKANAGFPVLRYNYDNGNIVTSGMKISVAGTVDTGDTPYDLWAAEFGVTNGPAGDDDLDGQANLYEYGLGGNPTNGFVDGNSPTFEPGAGGLEYIHAQRTNDSTLVYYLDLTSDLVNPAWTNLGYTVTGTNVTGLTFDFVTNVIDTADSAKFIRLQIDQTP